MDGKDVLCGLLILGGVSLWIYGGYRIGAYRWVGAVTNICHGSGRSVDGCLGEAAFPHGAGCICPDCGGDTEFWHPPAGGPDVMTMDDFSAWPRRCRVCGRIFFPEMEQPARIVAPREIQR